MKALIASIRKRLLRGTFSSQNYWSERYAKGGNSGPGSYGELAAFKARVLNDFVRDKKIESVIEFGCGDGNQLSLAAYPRYIGYDVSAAAISMCRERFAGGHSKEFFLAHDYDDRKADLALSLDVIFHLTEDEVFEAYMRRLFAAGRRFVIVYSSDFNEVRYPAAVHVRHRHFTQWVERELGEAWTLAEKIANDHPYGGDYRTTSFSDFFIYEKR